MTKIAFVFPGQGSQSVGMLSGWGSHQSLVDEVFAEASQALGYNLFDVVQNGPEQRLNQTEITQPAMLCAGVASWRIIQQQNVIPAAIYMAGHSLGEYTALVCARSLTLADAAKLLAERGRLMQAAVGPGDGLMAVIIGLSDEIVIEACASVESGTVEAVNFNAPGQVVIAGHSNAVEQAMQNSKALGAKRALPLAVSVPSHCSLMRDASAKLHDALIKVDLKMPVTPVIHNQNAGIAESTDEIRALLSKQLFNPVKWVESVNYMHTHGVGYLVECGPGKVLSGLTKRIQRSMQGLAVYDAESLDKTSQAIAES